jgi:short-subunit dehydrogenase
MKRKDIPIDEPGTALVTGASSGIGYELAKCFAEAGHDLILVSRSQSDLRAVADDLAEAYGVTATPIAKDLSRRGAADELFEEVQGLGLEVDYLVNDAGLGVYGKFAGTELADEINIIELNVIAAVALTKLFLQPMIARGRGRILQVASMVSKNPAPYAAVYSATKAFIYNFSEAVAQELDGTGVTMTALRPGATATAFFHKAHAEDMRLVREGKLGPADAVAREGFEALMRGDTEVVAGLANKIQDKVANMLPDSVKAKVAKRQHEPKHEAEEAE